MGHKNNAKHAFWYMLSLVALIFMAIATGQALFQIINSTIADATADMYSAATNSEMLKFAISALIISIPVYFLTMRQIQAALVKGDMEKDSPIRRWLTYVILFVSAVTMIVTMILTINNFLGGEFTARFILKAVSTIVLAGIIFFYYLYDIRRDSIKKRDTVSMIYLMAALIITIGALVASFFFVESPKEARARKHDAQVINSFNQIDGGVNTYFADKKTLPEKLEQLSEESVYLNDATLRDPATGRAYEYKKLDDKSYQLCAEFNTSNKNNDNKDLVYNGSDRWPHDAGYQCLKQKIVSPVDTMKVAPLPTR